MDGGLQKQKHFIHNNPVLMTKESFKDCIKLPKHKESVATDWTVETSQQSSKKFNATWPRQNVQNPETYAAKNL